MKLIRCWYVSYYLDGTIVGKKHLPLGEDYLCVYVRTHTTAHMHRPPDSLGEVVLPFCHVGLRN